MTRIDNLADRSPPKEGQTYRIGAVSRLTGIPADTLRVWERRYHVTTPIRSDSGTRLYDSEDVGRLSLIKRLVDRGDAISSVANLSLDALRERLRSADLIDRSPVARVRPWRLLVSGPYLADRLRVEASSGAADFECLGFLSSREGIFSFDRDPAPDVLVLEYPGIHADQVGEVHRLLARSGATHCVLVYGFAGQGVLEQLVSERLVARRSPIGMADLRRCCQAFRPVAPPPSDPIERLGIDLARPAPGPRFSASELAAIASASASPCDCHRHLVDLISALYSFESYSRECAIREGAGSAAQALVQACAAQARALLEEGLSRSLGLSEDGRCDGDTKDSAE